MEKIQNFLRRLTDILEIVIAFVVAAGVIVGLIALLEYLGMVFSAGTLETYDVFQKFLSYALLLIIGVELILMVINHSARAILELILFVIARKMLIYATTMGDLVLGAIAVAIIFAIPRFLIDDNVEHSMSRFSDKYITDAAVTDDAEANQAETEE